MKGMFDFWDNKHDEIWDKEEKKINFIHVGGKDSFDGDEEEQVKLLGCIFMGMLLVFLLSLCDVSLR